MSRPVRLGNSHNLKAEYEYKTTKKANQVRLLIMFIFVWVVGADGLEPPTYAV